MIHYPFDHFTKSQFLTSSSLPERYDGLRFGLQIPSGQHQSLNRSDLVTRIAQFKAINLFKNPYVFRVSIKDALSLSLITYQHFK